MFVHILPNRNFSAKHVSLQYSYVHFRQTQIEHDLSKLKNFNSARITNYNCEIGGGEYILSVGIKFFCRPLSEQRKLETKAKIT